MASHPLQLVQHHIVAFTYHPDVSGNLKEVGVVGRPLTMEALGGDVLN